MSQILSVQQYAFAEMAKPFPLEAYYPYQIGNEMVIGIHLSFVIDRLNSLFGSSWSLDSEKLEMDVVGEAIFKGRISCFIDLTTHDVFGGATIRSGETAYNGMKSGQSNLLMKAASIYGVGNEIEDGRVFLSSTPDGWRVEIGDQPQFREKVLAIEALPPKQEIELNLPGAKTAPPAMVVQTESGVKIDAPPRPAAVAKVKAAKDLAKISVQINEWMGWSEDVWNEKTVKEDLPIVLEVLGLDPEVLKAGAVRGSKKKYLPAIYKRLDEVRQGFYEIEGYVPPLGKLDAVKHEETPEPEPEPSEEQMAEAGSNTVEEAANELVTGDLSPLKEGRDHSAAADVWIDLQSKGIQSEGFDDLMKKVPGTEGIRDLEEFLAYASPEQCAALVILSKEA